MAESPTRDVLSLLEQFECRNTTFRDPDGSWPIVWERAQGVHVWDAEGRRYLDLTAAFGVAAAGHANPAVVKAGQDQMGRLLHAMGDVHPHALKAHLARELSNLTYGRWKKGQPGTKSAGTHGKTLFCNSGFEAVEAALKTAHLATRRPGIIAFEGAYHGLGYGALNATHRDHFRTPFRSQLKEFGHFVPFPDSKTVGSMSRAQDAITALISREEIGAVLVEPIQARGGIREPHSAFLPWLAAVCRRTGVLLILDEIYTGFGRTGTWFACEESGVVPDLLCLGKALTGGFPLSACVGRAELMDKAWPRSTGEAIHTSTFLGHPVGCAMALAQLKELGRLRLAAASARLGPWLQEELSSLLPANGPLVGIARGRGLMAGIEVRDHEGQPASQLVLKAMKELLRNGFIVLPEGEHSNVLGFTPPLTITKAQLASALDAAKRFFQREMPEHS